MGRECENVAKRHRYKMCAKAQQIKPSFERRCPVGAEDRVPRRGTTEAIPQRTQLGLLGSERFLFFKEVLRPESQPISRPSGHPLLKRGLDRKRLRRIYKNVSEGAFAESLLLKEGAPQGRKIECLAEAQQQQCRTECSWVSSVRSDSHFFKEVLRLQSQPISRPNGHPLSKRGLSRNSLCAIFHKICRKESCEKQKSCYNGTEADFANRRSPWEK